MFLLYFVASLSYLKMSIAHIDILFFILFLLLLVAWSASAEATAGYWGTCTWEITTEGVLVIGPGTGVDTNEHFCHRGDW